MKSKALIPNTPSKGEGLKNAIRSKTTNRIHGETKSCKNAMLSKFLKPNTLRSKDLKKCNKEQTNL